MLKRMMPAAGRMWAVMIVLMALMSGSAAAIQIDVASEPRLGTTNRLTNPDFEQGGSGPSGWNLSISSSHSGRINGRWSDDSFTGSKSVYMDSKSGEVAGYWVQRAVPVEPNETLLLSSWLKLGAEGRVLMFVVGYNGKTTPRTREYDNQRLYLFAVEGHPLYPVFVNAEMLKGLVGRNWQRERIFIQNTAEVTEVDVSLGSYFSPGEAWFDSAYFGVPWVQLSVDVKAGPGSGAIQRVEIYDDGGRLTYDSGVLANMTKAWNETIQVSADAKHYKIVVTDGDGRNFEYVYH